MNSLDRFKLKMQYTGNSLREENIFNSIKLLDEVFNDDASCTMGIYMWSVGKTGKEFYKDDIPLRIRLFKREFSAANGVVKGDITALGIPAQDTTYVDATTGASGLMSATDKTKLDGIVEGADKLPEGGTTGQVLTKTADGEAWQDASKPDMAGFAKLENLLVITPFQWLKKMRR